MKKIARIPGAFGKQKSIEADLMRGYFIGAFCGAKSLPDCSQKTEYMRLIVEAEIKCGTYFAAVEPALFLPQNECIRRLTEAVEKSWEKGRGDWVEKVLEKFPNCEKRKELVEVAISRFLANHNIYAASRLADLAKRPLTKKELEKYIADNLLESFHSARKALEILGREISYAEIRAFLSHNEEKGNFHGLLFVARNYPEFENIKSYAEKALAHYLRIGAPSEVQDALKILGRELSLEEEKVLFEASIKKGGLIFSNPTGQAKELSKNPNNIPYLEDILTKLIESGNTWLAFKILKALENFTRKQDFLELICEKMMAREIPSGFNKDLALEIIEELRPCKISGRAAKQLYDSMPRVSLDSEDDIESVLRIARLLPNSEKKISILEDLLNASKKLEARRSHGDHPVVITYKVVKALDECA